METHIRSTEERIEELHSRAADLKRKKEGRQLAGLGGASVFLTILLMTVMIHTGGPSQSITGDQLTGSSLLSDSAGGYVLAAVIAFFAGVIVTAVSYRYRKK